MSMEVLLHEADSHHEVLEYVVIAARYQGRWVFVRHKDRSTWEIPGGHIEQGETVTDAAKRELWEETGAVEFTIDTVCDYSVRRDGIASFGRLFLGDIRTLGDLPGFEIEELTTQDTIPSDLTYEEIQPLLFRRVLQSIA